MSSGNDNNRPLLSSAESEDVKEDERDARVSLAAQYVECALEGLPLRLEPHSTAEARAVRVLGPRDGIYRYVVSSLVVATVMVAPLTPSRSEVAHGPARSSRSGFAKGSAPAEMARIVVTVCCVLLLLDCVALTWVFRNEWLRRGWHRIRVFCLAATLVNNCALPRFGGPFSALTGLPAVLLVAEFAELRRTIASMAATVPATASVVALFAGVLLIYAHLGVLLWRECFEHGWHGHGSADVDDEDDGLGVEFKGGFDTVGRAAWSLFVLSTTENYPFVMYPALDCHHYPFSVPIATVYFVSFIFIVIYILVTMLLAAFYEAWRIEHNKLFESEKVNRYHALVAAFHVLACNSQNTLTLNDWRDLVTCLRPGISESRVRGSFRVLADDTDSVTFEQFVLRCLSVIRAHVDVDTLIDRLMATTISPIHAATTSGPQEPQSTSRQDDCSSDDQEEMLSEKTVAPRWAWCAWWQSTGNVLSSRYSRILCREWLSSKRVIVVLHSLVAVYLVCEAAREGVSSRRKRTRMFLDGISVIVLVAFAYEHVLRATIFLSNVLLFRPHEGLDAAFVLLALLCRFVVQPLSEKGGAMLHSGHDDGGSVARHVAGACVAARLLVLSPKTRHLVWSIAQVWRLLGLFLTVFAIAIYAYAAVAVELCAGVLPGRHHWTYEVDDDAFEDANHHDRDRGVLDNRVAFNSLSEAWEVLLRIAVTNNFQDVINAHLFSSAARHNASSARRMSIAILLFSFYILAVWLFCNVMAALVIDAMLNSRQSTADRKSEEERERDDIDVFRARGSIPEDNCREELEDPRLSGRALAALRQKVSRTRQHLSERLSRLRRQHTDSLS